MNEMIIVALLLVGVILCALNLGVGMFLTLAAGFLQDPLRKIIPGEPVYYSVLVLLFAAFTFAGAAQSGALRPFRAIPGWNSQLKGPITLFVAVVVLQSIASFLYTGSIALAGIGLLVYLSPFPALQLAYSFASNTNRVYGFLWVYVVVSAAMVSGVYLSWLEVDWEILRSVGEPLVVYSLETGEPLELPSGFLRAPEVAAWHAASGACVALILGLSKGRKDSGFVSVALMLFFIGAVMLTGRRKFLLEVAVFLPIVWWLLWRFRMATSRILYLIFGLSLAAAVVIASGLVQSDTREAFQAPAVRGESSGVSTVIERFRGAIESMPIIVDQNGVFGSGAGSGSQGAQYFGGGDARVGFAAEGGLGKILAEIGIPGVLVFLFLIFRLAVIMWQTLGLARRGTADVARLIVGVAAFLASNAVVFIIAHQVYGDPFILLLIGTFVGFTLATHRLVEMSRVPDRLPMQAGVRSRLRSSAFLR